MPAVQKGCALEKCLSSIRQLVREYGKGWGLSSVEDSETQVSVKSGTAEYNDGFLERP